MKQSSFKILSFLVTMILSTSCLFILFTYINTLNVQSQNVIYSGFRDESEFETQRFTWICKDESCVKVLAQDEEEEQTLTSCKMLCGEPPIWPKPSKLKISKKKATIINPQLISFNNYLLENSLLVKAMKLFVENLPQKSSLSQTGLTIHIVLSHPSVTQLKLATDESYNLFVKSENNMTVNILAENFFGARHALETLSQLIWFDEVAEEVRILHDVEITDKPEFPYRGISVDTARNFFPIKLLQKVVDGMAMSKLNTLHLHLTDAVSFPIVLPRVMQLASFGAYSSKKFYTSQEINDLVHYAVVRGVRLLLEVDAPSHVNAGWNFSQKKYVICGEDNIFNGHLNPDNEEAFSVLEDIYSDLLELSGSNELFHLGGDEVNLTCWRDTQAAKQAGGANTKLWSSVTNRMLARLKSANEDAFPEEVIMWSSKLTESPYLEELDLKVTVQHWLGDPSGVLNRGHKIIYSTVGYWYLDCGFGPWKSGMKNGVCDPYTPWQKFYNYRPWQIHGKRALALGGEVCLWSEQVNSDTLETRIWPRAAAFAERIWSDPVDTNRVHSRLVSFSELLQNRGMRVEAIGPQWCTQNPDKC